MKEREKERRKEVQTWKEVRRKRKLMSTKWARR